jgi:hypothetical protein
MKNLIEKALTEAMVKLDKQTPQTKKSTKSVSILHVAPVDLPQFMTDNEIPKDACFDGRDNGYDAWDDILLSWTVDVPTTTADKMKFRMKRFTNLAWTEMYALVLKNGYKRVGYNTALLREFENTCVYEMFIAQDFDRLEKYYSLPFVKED